MSQTVERREPPRVYNGKAEAARRAEGEAMLADQVRGMRVSQLCDKYGVSHATIARRLKKALDERIPVTVEARREQLNASLDEQLAGWQQNYEAGTMIIQQATTVDPETGEPRTDVGQVERGLKVRADALAGIARVDERRAKLDGVDAPVKAQVEVVQVTAQEKELRDLLAAAAAAQQQREDALLDEGDD